jgi:hypothetical protein
MCLIIFDATVTLQTKKFFEKFSRNFQTTGFGAILGIWLEEMYRQSGSYNGRQKARRSDSHGQHHNPTKRFRADSEVNFDLFGRS